MVAEDKAPMTGRALDGHRKALEGGSLFFLFMLAVRGVSRDTFTVRREGLPSPSLEIPVGTVGRDLSALNMFSLIVLCELVRFPWAFTVGRGHKISWLSSGTYYHAPSGDNILYSPQRMSRDFFIDGSPTVKAYVNEL